jgi:hypothetical protein
MLFRPALSILFVYFIVLVAPQENDAKAKGSGPTYVEIVSVSKKEFLLQFNRSLPKDFWDTQSPFRECFDLSDKLCLKEVNSSIARCAEQTALPSKIRLDLAAGALGEKLGRCVGSDFDKQNQKRRIVNDYCKRRDTWLSKY